MFVTQESLVTFCIKFIIVLQVVVGAFPSAAPEGLSEHGFDAKRVSARCGDIGARETGVP